MFNGYAKIISRNIYELKQGTGLKILTPETNASKASTIII